MVNLERIAQLAQSVMAGYSAVLDNESQEVRDQVDIYQAGRDFGYQEGFAAAGEKAGGESSMRGVIIGLAIVTAASILVAILSSL
jgi:hypothetical protein